MREELTPSVKRKLLEEAEYSPDSTHSEEAADNAPKYKAYEFTDIGTGNLFADRYGSMVRYIAQAGSYSIWNGKNWAEDEKEQISELAKMLVSQDMPTMASMFPTDAERAAWLGWTQKLQSNRARSEILRSARSKPEIAARLIDFDTQDRYLNVENGILDLDTMTLLPHDPTKMLSLLANAIFDPKARCPRWERFIIEITGGDGELELFLQKAIGYSLCGNPIEDCLFILYGMLTRNGKSTFMRAILNTIGDYGRTAKPESIAINRNKNGSGPNSDIARLRNPRLVNMSEPPKGMELDAATVKSLTGRDPITARFLHQEFFEFIPRFVIFMNTNHLPRIDDMTLFSSGRIFCIPFNIHFPTDKQERNLLEQFSTQ